MHNLDKPCIICVAITGSLTTKRHNPAVPISVSEQIESTQEAFEAGATICHAHVRNEDGTPSSDPEKFQRLQEGIRTHCPGMIMQFSTGGRSATGSERGAMLSLQPDMASLAVGSTNFPNRVYENPPDLVSWLASEMRAHCITPEIEAFDLSHIYNAASMHAAGLLFGRLYVQFVFGVKNAMPPDRAAFDFFRTTLQRLAPGTEWCAAGIGRYQQVVNDWAIAAGGHARVGFEDNVRLDRDNLASSNAALVRRAREICDNHGRSVATTDQARLLLGLPSDHVSQRKVPNMHLSCKGKSDLEIKEHLSHLVLASDTVSEVQRAMPLLLEIQETLRADFSYSDAILTNSWREG